MAIRWAKGVEQLLVPIEQVRQNPDNPNNGDDDNLIESIKTNGFVTAITADANTGYITAGNTRYRALLALGSKHIPVIWVDHWDESGATRYLVGDNESSRRAVMDEHLLLPLLELLRDTEIGLVGSGWDDERLDRLAAALDDDGLPGDQGGIGVAVNGIYEVVVRFEEEGERNVILSEMEDRFGEEWVRAVNG